jgi:serine/threonine-protein kinase
VKTSSRAPGSGPDSTHPPLGELEIDGLLRAAFRSPASAADEAPATELALRGGFERERSEYRIVDEIARGGMGVVLRVRDEDLRRELAVKVLREGLADDDATLARFVEEAQIGGQLQHPGIVPVYELGRMADRRPYFAMKLIRGRTLAALLLERKSPEEDPHRFLAIFDQVCQAIAYAHARGVVHRDLKPGNVMIGSFGEVQVVDWGLAKVLGDRPEGGQPVAAPRARTIVTTLRSGRSTSHSIAGTVMGTPAYMPPEQARGEVGRVDERADVFALGAILCEILTGRPPYRGEKDQPADVALARTRERLAKLSSAPELGDLCVRSLSPGRDERPRSAAELATAIGAYRSSIEERARAAQIEAAEARVRAATERRARRLTVALAGAIVVLAVLGIGVRFWIREQADARRARTADLVGAALDRATLAFGQASSSTDLARWDEASAAIVRARNLLDAGESSGDLDERTKDLAERIRSGAAAARSQSDLESSNRDLLAKLSLLRLPEIQIPDPATWARVDAGYASAFRDHGIEIDGRSVEDAGRAIRERGIGVEVAAGLDGWATERARTGKPEDAARIVRIAETADPDETRTRIRTAVLEKNTSMLVACAKEARLETLPIDTLTLLGNALARAELPDEAMRVLHVALDLRPSDYVANTYLARIVWDRDYDEAARRYAAALAARPDDAVAVREYGWLLDHYLLESSRAIALYRREIETHPDDPTLYLYLGHALMNHGDYDEAIDAYSQTLRLDPQRATAKLRLVECSSMKGDSDAVIRICDSLQGLGSGLQPAQRCLGEALFQRGDLPGAVRELRLATTGVGAAGLNGEAFHRALEASGDDVAAFECARTAVAERIECLLGFFDIGLDIGDLLDVDAAIATEREQLHESPASPSRHALLGVLLRSKGRSSEALFELRAADDLGAVRRNWALPGENDFTRARRLILEQRRSPGWVAAAQHESDLAERLERVARGEDHARDRAEALEFARLALRRGRIPEAASLFESALEGRDSVEFDGSSPRVEAAAAAVTLGCGSSEGARWRERAAAWMSADLDALSVSAKSDEIPRRSLATRTIGRWRRDPRLDCVRGADAIAKLPAEEQETWRRLWARFDEVSRSLRAFASSKSK